jgi:phosphatidylethanolamine N-methyltransferase
MPLDFVSIRRWLLKIVHVALDSDPELVPKSQVEPPQRTRSSELLTPTAIHPPRLTATTAHSLEVPPLSLPLPASLSSSATGSGSSSLSSSSMQLSSGAYSGPGSSASAWYDVHDDDFKFWSERQAKRISYAISQVLSIEFAPEVIVADANVTALTKRILASKELLGP